MACLVVGVVKTTARLANLTKEEENKTQECRVFYVFISSVQLKSLGQTNLECRNSRKKWMCVISDGLLTSNPRLTFRSDSNPGIFWRILILTISLVEAHKESRQKRLAGKGQTILVRRRELTSSLLCKGSPKDRARFCLW